MLAQVPVAHPERHECTHLLQALPGQSVSAEGHAVLFGLPLSATENRSGETCSFHGITSPLLFGAAKAHRKKRKKDSTKDRLRETDGEGATETTGEREGGKAREKHLEGQRPEASLRERQSEKARQLSIPSTVLLLPYVGPAIRAPARVSPGGPSV